MRSTRRAGRAAALGRPAGNRGHPKGVAFQVVSQSQPGAVVIGGETTGLIALRALAEAGVRVALVVTAERDFARHSRWARDCHRVPPIAERPEELLGLLERQAERWRGWALLPMSDVALELLSRHREALARRYAVAAPEHAVARRLLSKDLTYAAAQEVGVDLPAIHGPADAETAGRADLVFPLLVKPFDSARFRDRFGQKVFVAHGRAELQDAVARLQGAGLAGQIQELVPGLDDEFYNYSVFIDRRGEPVAELGMHKLRKSPPHFGVCRAAEAAELPELGRATLALLRHIGWRGMANAEFKRDPRDGRFRLMEVNGRGFLMQGLAWRAGVNYPLLAYRDAVFGKAGTAAWNGWDGVWIDLLSDLYYAAFYRRVEGIGLGAYFASYRRRKAFAVWSLADPGPFLARSLGGLWKTVWLALSRRERARLRSGVGLARLETAPPAAGPGAAPDSPPDSQPDRGEPSGPGAKGGRGPS